MLGLRFTRSSNLLAHARVSSERFQYQGVVRYVPCAACQPRACTSVIKLHKPAYAMLWVTPNSLAALMVVVRSAPTLARPKISALELCACRTKEEKPEVPSGTRERPFTSPPLASITLVVSFSSAWPKL